MKYLIYLSLDLLKEGYLPRDIKEEEEHQEMVNNMSTQRYEAYQLGCSHTKFSGHSHRTTEDRGSEDEYTEDDNSEEEEPEYTRR